jgi:hypothetical protein
MMLWKWLSNRSVRTGCSSGTFLFYHQQNESGYTDRRHFESLCLVDEFFCSGYREVISIVFLFRHGDVCIVIVFRPFWEQPRWEKRTEDLVGG